MHTSAKLGYPKRLLHQLDIFWSNFNVEVTIPSVCSILQIILQYPRFLSPNDHLQAIRVMITSYFVKKCPHFLPKMNGSITCMLPGFCQSVRMWTHICGVACQSPLRCPWSRPTPGSLYSPLFVLALPSLLVQWLSPCCFYIHTFPVVWSLVILCTLAFAFPWTVYQTCTCQKLNQCHEFS